MGVWLSGFTGGSSILVVSPFWALGASREACDGMASPFPSTPFTGDSLLLFGLRGLSSGRLEDGIVEAAVGE